MIYLIIAIKKPITSPSIEAGRPKRPCLQERRFPNKRLHIRIIDIAVSGGGALSTDKVGHFYRSLSLMPSLLQLDVDEHC